MTESGVSAQGKIRPFSTLYTCATHIEVKKQGSGNVRVTDKPADEYE